MAVAGRDFLADDDSQLTRALERQGSTNVIVVGDGGAIDLIAPRSASDVVQSGVGVVRVVRVNVYDGRESSHGVASLAHLGGTRRAVRSYLSLTS